MISSACHRPFAEWIAILAAGAYLGLTGAQAQPAAEAPGQDQVPASRRYLGQGMALFDAREFRSAERALQAALYVGLPQASEQAIAHKLLAFVSCSRGERKRCNEAFRDALAVEPDFVLSGHEARNPVWRASYLQARKSAIVRTDSKSTGTALRTGPEPTTGNAGMAAWHPDSASKDGNVRLRVEPWASVQVNGKTVGVTPPVTRLKLPPGTHSIRLTNPGFKPARQVIRVVRDGAVTVHHDFETR